ncbi:MAG: class I adenylate-forming enzyme family protein [Euzebya sp.]
MNADPVFEPLPYLGTTVQAFVGRPESHDQLLRRAAVRWPSRIAVECSGGMLTYAELNDAVSSAAASVRALAQEGDRVAVAMGQDLALFIVPFVASRAGITVLLLNTALTPKAWSDQLRKAEPVAVIADAHNLHAATTAAAPGRFLVVSSDLAWVMDRHTDVRFPEGLPDQTLALIATSGTTGVPKMSRVSTSGLIHAGLAYVHLLGLGGQDRSYVCLPLHYIGPLSAQSTTMPLVGGTNVIPADSRPVGAIRKMAQAEITYVDAVPAWLSLLVRDDDIALPLWRTLIYGGAPMPTETASLLDRRFPDLRLWDVWGLSETHGPATALQYNHDAPALPGTVGRPVPGVEVRTDIVDGGPGELLVRGANVTPGYADDEALSQTVIDQGWLRTGDIGTIGPDGTVRLLDRAKDVIMRGGANVFSVEVEQILAQHPDVIEAAVYAVPDERREEAVGATVVLKPGASLDVMALRTLVDNGVGRHAVPRHITATDNLPRNATGKIDKLLLRQQAAESRSMKES